MVNIISLVTDNNPSFNQRKENDRRNYFMINLHNSMGPGPDRTRNPGPAVGLATDCATGPFKLIHICLAYLGRETANSEDHMRFFGACKELTNIYD